MDESAEKEPIAVSNGGAEKPLRKIVRRRLVQSTLLPHKSPETESNADYEVNQVDLVDNDGEDEEPCGSQGKKRGRKRKEKGTPPTRAPRKTKQKSPMNSTPKKNGISNGNTLNNCIESEGASPPIPNLMLEAKLTAKENSQIFAGRQIHPFFSSWKVGKRNMETTEMTMQSNCSSMERSAKGIHFGPIHVFERTHDDIVAINWKDGTFCEETSVDKDCNLQGECTSIFGGCAESLNFDNFSSYLHPDALSAQQNHCAIQKDELRGTSFANPVMLVDDEVDNQQQSRFLQESDQPENSLWTEKYQPKKSTEVCGNTESVRFMSEWLQLWRERDFQAIKESTSVDTCNMEDDDYDCNGSDLDSEDIDGEDNLKNVLLITGPVGCGKSAAIHACATEKGFKILESNTSECRNGATVKQKLGEALLSRCLVRSLDNPVNSHIKHMVKSTEALSHDETEQEFDNEMIEMISIADEDDSCNIIETSGHRVSNESGSALGQAKVKALVLFEDVDITFPEDRGLVAAMQQIAKTAKGPVILTSNSNNPVLPDNLKRLELSFTMPTIKELLPHLHMVSAAEKANIQPHLIEKLIECCQGDIRKTIMNLQFWCQSKRDRKDRKTRKSYGLLPFDIEAGHQVLPKIIPWDFPSKLSELVEKEIAESLSMMEENPALIKATDVEELFNKMSNAMEMHNNEMDHVEAKKDAMLNRNFSIYDGDEFISSSGMASEFSNFLGTQVSSSKRNSRRKLVLMSSDSEDEHPNKISLVSERDNKEIFLKEGFSHCPNMQTCTKPLIDELHCSGAVKFGGRSQQYSQIVNSLDMEPSRSADISCVPESSFIPETEIDSRMDPLPRNGTSLYVAETIEVSVSSEFKQDLSPLEADDVGKPVDILVKNSDMLGTMSDFIAESSHEEVEGSQNEQGEAVSRGHELMDECSRMNFNRRSNPKEKFMCQQAACLVQESWRKLRNRHADLKQYVASEPEGALKIVELTYEMSDLISQADQLLSKCQMLDDLEPSMFDSENSEAFSWCDEQLKIFNTVSQHGFCLYTKEIAARGLKMGFENRVDLMQEMLASTTDMVALSKLLGQYAGSSMNSLAGSGLETTPLKSEVPEKSEVKSCLFNIIKSMVHSRFYLALEGDAFHEYRSSIGCMSRSEASRLSAGIGETRGRRVRRDRHYLSTGALMLSPEDISLLDQYNFLISDKASRKLTESTR